MGKGSSPFGTDEEPRRFRRADPGPGTKSRLIIFCDASEAALAAVVYIRFEYGKGTYETHLLMAKAKVAPIKDLTLPRKELAAAVIRAKLFQHVAEEMDMNAKEAILFSDSMTTLQWLCKPPRNWKQWVCNRCMQIHSVTDSTQWRHVPGTDNPADLPSRGVLVSNLVDNAKWFRGLDWLRRDEDSWPKEEAEPDSAACAAEEQKLPLLDDQGATALASAVESNQTIDKLWEISSWNRLVGTTGAILSWLPRNRGKVPAEVKAKRFWYKREQEGHFTEKVRSLGKERRGSSRQSSYTCYFDHYPRY